MTPGRLVIAVALRLEARAVVARLGAAPARWRLVRTGVGLGAARRGAARVLQEPDVAGVVVVGIGGALDPTLGAGGVVVPEKVRDESGDAWPVDAALRARLAGGAMDGLAVTVARPVRLATDKAALRARTGAVICEMEGAAWAAEARARRVPFAMVRAVADDAREDLPNLGRLADPTAGWWSAARILDPRVLRRLPALGRRAHAAAAAAAAHLQRVLE